MQLCAFVEARQIYYNKDAEETGILESSELLNEECEFQRQKPVWIQRVREGIAKKTTKICDSI